LVGEVSSSDFEGGAMCFLLARASLSSVLNILSDGNFKALNAILAVIEITEEDPFQKIK